MDFKTQKEKVLRHLRTHKNGITSMYAFWRYRITRLSHLIYLLRNEGKHIVTKREPNTFSCGYHGRYVLLNDKNWWE